MINLPPTSVPNKYAGYEEEAIISLILDLPEFYADIQEYIEPNLFSKLEAQFVLAWINEQYKQHKFVPTRELLHSQIAKKLTVDDQYEDILRIVDRKSNARDVPFLKAKLHDWAKHKAYDLLYSQEAIEAHQRGDHEFIDGIFQKASRVTDAGAHRGFWLFEQIDELFEESRFKHFSTGFPQLDIYINEGGPSPGEVLCWMAATNVGKSILLANNAIYSVMQGLQTLFITFEMSTLRTAARCLGAISETPLRERMAKKDEIIGKAMRMYNTHRGHLVIYELPEDECSVNHVYSIIESLKRSRGWKPDVLCLDYLDLMRSRQREYNKDEYTRQKHVANEIRALSKNEGILTYTATQTNRSGTAAQQARDNRDGQATRRNIDLNQSAESFGKNFSLDYVISLNQTEEEHHMDPPRVVFWIAKNRNGPKQESVHCTINYNCMKVREITL